MADINQPYVAKNREYDFWNLWENLEATAKALSYLGIRVLTYDYTNASDVELLITGLLANIDSLIEAAKVVQDFSRPITEEILTASLYLKNRMFQCKSDLVSCFDGSEDGIGFHHPRNIYDRTIPHLMHITQKYSTIFDNLRFKVEAISLMKTEEPTDDSAIGTPTKEQPWDKHDPNYIPIKEAVTDAKKKGRKISVSTLSRKLTPDGSMRYMRKYTKNGKPSRCRVHIADFRKNQETLPIINDQFSEEAFEGRQSEIKKEKKTKGILPDQDEGYNKLAKKILKQ